MSLIVSDTSPIRALAHLDLLDLPSQLFDVIFIPPAVEEELARPRKRFPPVRVDQIRGAAVRRPTNISRVQELELELQAGEAEAIALAEELRTNILIDERAGRRVATRSGLAVIGVVGLLVEAKRRDLVPAVVPSLLCLRNDLGFFHWQSLLDAARNQCGE